MYQRIYMYQDTCINVYLNQQKHPFLKFVLKSEFGTYRHMFSP